MGDENTILAAADVRHLLRRTGFGAPADKVGDFVGKTRGTAADTLLAFTPTTFRPSGTYGENLRAKWIKYMVKTKLPFQEKLVLFWHDHFANGLDKVDYTRWMGEQNKLFRVFCKGNFRDFVKAINKDRAMVEYLDTVRNHAESPNENYARELMELFTLGVTDLNGAANYTQPDIVQIARAFTGWDNDKQGGSFNDWDHDYSVDYPERGAKRIFVNAHGFGASGADFTQPGGEGAAEIDRVIDIILSHRDSDNKITSARYIARRMLTYLAHSSPTKAEIDAVVTASGFDTNWNLQSLLRAILVSDTFYAGAAGPPYLASSKKSVKWPIDYVISTMRLLNMNFAGSTQYINYSSYTASYDYLSDMGQNLFEPPSVFGWDWETGWISSATLLSRFEFATDLVRARGNGSSSFRPEKLRPIADLISHGPAAAAAIVDAVSDTLGIRDQVSAAERDTFITYLGGPAAVLDLENGDVLNTKLHGLFALVLQSPAYQLH